MASRESKPIFDDFCRRIKVPREDVLKIVVNQDELNEEAHKAGFSVAERYKICQEWEQNRGLPHAQGPPVASVVTSNSGTSAEAAISVEEENPSAPVPSDPTSSEDDASSQEEASTSRKRTKRGSKKAKATKTQGEKDINDNSNSLYSVEDEVIELNEEEGPSLPPKRPRRGKAKELWSQRLEVLKDFKASHGHCVVPQSETSLHNWLRKQLNEELDPKSHQRHRNIEQRDWRTNQLESVLGEDLLTWKRNNGWE